MGCFKTLMTLSIRNLKPLLTLFAGLNLEKVASQNRATCQKKHFMPSLCNKFSFIAHVLCGFLINLEV